MGLFGDFSFNIFRVRRQRPVWERTLDAIGAVRRCEGDSFFDTLDTAIAEIKRTSRDAGSSMQDGLATFRTGYEVELPRSEAAKSVFDSAVYVAIVRHFGGRVIRTVGIPALVLGCAIGVGMTLLVQRLIG